MPSNCEKVRIQAAKRDRKTKTRRRRIIDGGGATGKVAILNTAYVGPNTLNWSTRNDFATDTSIYFNGGPASGINFTGGTHELQYIDGTGTGIVVEEQQGVDSGVGVSTPAGLDTAAIYGIDGDVFDTIPGTFFNTTLRSNNTGASRMRWKYTGVAGKTIRVRAIYINVGTPPARMTLDAMTGSVESIVAQCPQTTGLASQISDPAYWTDQTYTPDETGVLVIGCTPSSSTSGLSCMVWEIFE